MKDFEAEISQIASGAAADQSTAAVVNVAGDVAAYHRKLLSEGVPKALAAELTKMAASYLLQSLVGGCGCEGE